LEGIFSLCIHILAILFGFIALAAELSLSTVYSPRVVRWVPFLKKRYGRAFFFMTGSLILFFLCHRDNIFLNIAVYALSFCGLMYGLMSMQPDNPVDYRGFQRPNSNDFLSRM